MQVGWGRRPADLGIVAAPLLFVPATVVLFGAYKQMSRRARSRLCLYSLWELGLALFLIFKGFKETSLDQRETPRISKAMAVAA